jgi:pyruvate-ferredoxin/flavodoxin oxidoreductase
VKGSQFLQPLFEYSGACAGCGETPYLKLASQLFGDRMVVANATGCSSIFGGNLPTTPWTCNQAGRGPAWANSLFEDNAEFGYGMRLSLDSQAAQAADLLRGLQEIAGLELAAAILAASPAAGPETPRSAHDEADLHEQRERVAILRATLDGWLAGPHAAGDPRRAQVGRLRQLADHLVKKSVWIVGGDGWAYDIGYGGLDHVLASGGDVNILVLDTEVYSNTGGQMSKATPRGAVARFAAAGKPLAKKDLGLLAITYGHVYVAQVALGASDTQTLKAFLEAESYAGPSLIIAYSHCIAHDIDMSLGMTQQARAVASGHWPLFRFDPRAKAAGRSPLTLDSRPPKISFTDYAYAEGRYNMLRRIDPATAGRLAEQAQQDVAFRWHLYQQLAALHAPRGAPAMPEPSPEPAG